MLGEDAKVGHHEDRVDRKHGDALRKVGIHHHEGGLGAAGRVAEDAAGADDHVEFHHLDEGRTRSSLVEDLTDVALLLVANEVAGEALVVQECES